MIKLKRETGCANVLQVYQVIVDGKKAGEIKNGREINIVKFCYCCCCFES